MNDFSKTSVFRYYHVITKLHIIFDPLNVKTIDGFFNHFHFLYGKLFLSCIQNTQIDLFPEKFKPLFVIRGNSALLNFSYSALISVSYGRSKLHSKLEMMRVLVLQKLYQSCTIIFRDSAVSSFVGVFWVITTGTNFLGFGILYYVKKILSFIVLILN